MSVTAVDAADVLVDSADVLVDGSEAPVPPVPPVPRPVPSAGSGSGGPAHGFMPQRTRPVVETHVRVPKHRPLPAPGLAPVPAPRGVNSADWNTALVLADFDVIEALLLLPRMTKMGGGEVRP